jgi:HEAT repeat protein
VRTKGRRVAVAAAVLGIAVAFIWAGLEVKHRIIEDRAIKRLKSVNREERGEAARALVKMGSVRAIPTLIELEMMSRFWFGDDSNKERWSAEKALLCIIERSGPAAVPVLVPLLRSDDGNVREHAADLLAEIGPEARAAVPALERALRTRNRDVRFQVRWALERIRVKKD